MKIFLKIVIGIIAVFTLIIFRLMIPFGIAERYWKECDIALEIVTAACGILLISIVIVLSIILKEDF